MPDNTVKMTLLPSGSTYIDNPLGAACGYRLDTSGCSIYVFPGVPIELYEMIPLAFPNLIRQAKPLVFATFGIAESHIMYKLRDIDLPEHAFHATRRVWLTLYPETTQRAELQMLISERIGEYVFDIGNKKRSLIDVVAEQLWTREEMIATAEELYSWKTLFLVHFHFWFFCLLSRRCHRLLQ